MKDEEWQKEIVKVLKSKYLPADINLKISLSADKVLADYLELAFKNASEEQRFKLLALFKRYSENVRTSHN